MIESALCGVGLLLYVVGLIVYLKWLVVDPALSITITAIGLWVMAIAGVIEFGWLSGAGVILGGLAVGMLMEILTG